MKTDTIVYDEFRYILAVYYHNGNSLAVHELYNHVFEPKADYYIVFDKETKKVILEKNGAALIMKFAAAGRLGEIPELI